MALALVCAIATGCGITQTSATNDRFEKIYSEDNTYRVFVDKDTGVMYLFVKSGYSGGLSVMVDTDGKPLIWEGVE